MMKNNRDNINSKSAYPKGLDQSAEKVDVETRMFVPVGLNLKKPQFNAPSLGLKRVYLYICIVVVLVVVLVVLRTISNMRFMFNEYHSESDTDGELVVLPERFADSRGAFCLDGSPGGYYLRKGKSADINKWIFHLQPGAWCDTIESCYKRSFSQLGSSLKAPLFSSFGGILSADEEINPDFHTWNMVQFLYCDGSSFLGNKSEVTHFKNRALYFRGAAIFSALVDFLLMHTDLSSADQVILTGSSAGGLAALINVDFLRKKLTSVKTMHAILDAMLFLDGEDINGIHTMRDQLKKVYFLHGVYDAKAIKECTSSLSRDTGWKCLNPLYFYKYLFTPAFFINSQYDTWLLHNPVGIRCDIRNPGTCKKREINAIYRYKKYFFNSIQPLKVSVHDGIFINACPVHTLLVNSGFSNSVKVNRTSLQRAISQWYFHQFPTPVKYVEDLGLHESSRVCPLIHGL